MSKPGAFELTKLAKDFLFENKDVFKQKMGIFLPAGIALTALTQFSALYKIAPAQIGLLAAMMILQGFFALGWTRLSIQGRGHEGVSMRAGADWRYVLLFIFLALFPALPSVAANVFVLFQVKSGGGFEPSAAFSILVIGSSLAALYGTLSHLFILPARAVGADVSWAGARAASRGIRLKLLGAFLIYLLIFVLCFYLYSAAIGIVAMTFGGDASFNQYVMIAISTVLSIPVFVGILILIALTSTMIARAYEWGLANNKI